MKFHLDVAPSVIKEARKIYKYREKEQKGSGERFINALAECYSVLKENPYGFQIRKDPFRHVMLRRLKYRLVYKVDGQLISVMQLRHMSRKPSQKFGP